jgi:hypothetical protein
LALPVNLAVIGAELSVDLPAGEGAGEVWIYALAKDVPVAVGRGENRGHTITYHNVARSWRKLGDWNGKTARFTAAVTELTQSGADTAAVLVQSGTATSPGRMLGAATAVLR